MTDAGCPVGAAPEIWRNWTMTLTSRDPRVLATGAGMGGAAVDGTEECRVSAGETQGTGLLRPRIGSVVPIGIGVDLSSGGVL